MSDTFLYVEYTGTGPTIVITKWRPNVTMEERTELHQAKPADVQADSAPTGSYVANWWREIMKIQMQRMIDEPIDVEDGTWTTVENGVETPIERRS